MKTSLIKVVFTALALSACTSAPKETTVEIPTPETSVSSKPVVAASESSPMSATDVSTDNLAAQLHEISQKSIYFDFNKFEIKPDFRKVIQQQVDFFKTHSNIVITLEGNADERGSNEYNLALGDKRANTVRKALELLGIPNNSLKVASYGEEKPRLNCHEEKCWMENRRVDFIVKQGP